MWKRFPQKFEVSSLDDPEEPQGNCVDCEKEDFYFDIIVFLPDPIHGQLT